MIELEVSELSPSLIVDVEPDSGNIRNIIGKKDREFELVKNLASLLVSDTDIETLCQKFVNGIVHELKYNGGAILLVDGDYLRPYTYSSSSWIQAAIDVLPVPFQKIEVPINAEQNHTVRSYLDKRIYVGSDVRTFISPPIARPIAAMMQKISGAKTIATVPGDYQGTINCVLLFSFKTKTVTRDNIALIEVFANQAAAAIANSNLHHQVLSQLNQLEIQYNELKALDDAKTKFIFMISHQLRTPITLLKLAMSMFERQDLSKLSDTAKTVLNDMSDSVNRLTNTVESILQASYINLKKDEFELSRCDLSLLIRETAEPLATLAKEKNLAYSIETEPDEILILADQTRLIEAIRNIIENAIFYTKSGSVKLTLKNGNGYANLYIEDTGIGIPQGFDIFKEFERSESALRMKPSGTGLGLFLAQHIISSHKGKLSYKDKPGGGTIFKINLPLLVV